ncbi:MAG TPA: DUF4335 domain-containing protein [Oscillatoriaceae cyanobacterium M33_DOE_052]|nr:DUF4335 domain-containing protein [Oscillatoriaceae cyanobacterium M33_DOE_052]
MSSFNSVQRRWTPPTCTLEISAKRNFFQWGLPLHNLSFNLSFDAPQLSPEEHVMLTGNGAELEALHNAVSTYVEKILQPHPHQTVALPPNPDAEGDGETGSRGDGETGRQGDGETGSVSPVPWSPSRSGGWVEEENPTLSRSEEMGEEIFLRRVGVTRHELSLGPLATPESGPLVHLGTLQLFDLATALDAWGAEMMGQSFPIGALERRQPIKTANMVGIASACGVLLLVLGTAAFALRGGSGEQEQSPSSPVSQSPSLPVSGSPRPPVSPSPRLPVSGSPRLPVSPSPTLPITPSPLPPTGNVLPPPPPPIPLPPPAQLPLEPETRNNLDTPPATVPSTSAVTIPVNPPAAPPPAANPPLVIIPDETPATAPSGGRVSAGRGNEDSSLDRAPVDVLAEARRDQDLSINREMVNSAPPPSGNNLDQPAAAPPSPPNGETGGRGDGGNEPNIDSVAGIDAPPIPNIPLETPNESLPAAAEGDGVTGDGETGREGDGEMVPPESGLEQIPQLEEAKAFFEKTWQPPEGFLPTLEYSLKLNPDGTIAQITPVGEASQTHVDISGIPLMGEPFVSPVADDRSPTLRILLQPNGTVQTFLQSVN